MISRSEILHIAGLARLELREQEIEKMQKELANILEYINVLQEVDVSNVEPTSHSVSLDNVMREDESQDEISEVIQKILEQVSEKEGSYVKVKGIL